MPGPGSSRLNVVTAVNSAILDVRAAMLLSTTGGDDEMNGSSWRSPTAKPSKPSSSASTALSTTSRSRSAGTLLLTRYGVRMVRNQRQQQKLQCSSSTSGCLVVVTPTTPSGPCRRSGRPTDAAQHEPRPGPVHSRLGQPAGYDSETMPHRSSSRLRRTPAVLLSMSGWRHGPEDRVLPKASRWTSRVTAAVLR